LLSRSELILIEASIVERLRRSGKVSFHDRLEHAHLIHDGTGRRELRALYREYIGIAEGAGRPLLLCTPTWRANRERVLESEVDRALNEHAVDFLRQTRDELSSRPDETLIGGLIGCRNDCYRPEEGLGEVEAEDFHSWQIERLAGAGCDFLLASTLPALPEALGIARAMAGRGVAYLISFVIGRDGRVLDGTELGRAIREVEARADPAPAGYMVNCAHPSFLDPRRLGGSALSRLVGYQANASALDHAELDEASELKVDDVEDWAARMADLNRRFGVTILGGCCGTSGRHLSAIVRELEDRGGKIP
jgi:S-methylmethionine-dependent homocysteine/selenocysteine methylase